MQDSHHCTNRDMKRIVPSTIWVALALVFACAWVQAQTPATVNSDKVNVRGRPSIFSEVITQLHIGEKVQILEEIKFEKTKLGDPAVWAKIAMPENTPLWVNASMVDSDTKSVRVRKLNVRAGPSENFSVVAVLAKDAVVKEIRTAGDWMEIETPEDAFAYVAMEYLDKEVSVKPEPEAQPPVPEAAKETPATIPAEEKAKPAVVPAEEAAKPTPPVTQPNTVPPAQPASPPSPEPVATQPTPAKTELPPAVSEPVIAPVPAVVPSGVTKRIVRREGVVKSTVSIQAPTHFELASADNGKVMNYISPITPDIDIKGFKGRRVVVTGEEMLDPRWPKTPVIVIESIELAP